MVDAAKRQEIDAAFQRGLSNKDGGWIPLVFNSTWDQFNSEEEQHIKRQISSYFTWNTPMTVLRFNGTVVLTISKLEDQAAYEVRIYTVKQQTLRIQISRSTQILIQMYSFLEGIFAWYAGENKRFPDMENSPFQAGWLVASAYHKRGDFKETSMAMHTDLLIDLHNRILTLER